jgi:outer membrane receptor protein involved in Fe transport
MKTRSATIALVAAMLLAAPSVVGASAAADPSVSEKDFDAQTQAIQQGLEVTQESGVFGRPGDVPGMEGPRSSSVGDRELDRYVQRLGFELRMRNAISDRDPEGFR